MIFLKWFSIVYITLSLIYGIYTSGKNKDIIKLFVTIIILIPIFIYLILS